MWAPMHWDLIQNKNRSDRAEVPSQAGQARAWLLHSLLLVMLSVMRVTLCYHIMAVLFSSSLYWCDTDNVYKCRYLRSKCDTPHSSHLVYPAASPWIPGGCMRWCPPCPCITGSPSVPLSVLSQLILLVHVVSASTDWQPPLLSSLPALGTGTQHPSLAWPAHTRLALYTGPQLTPGPSLLLLTNTGIITSNHWHHGLGHTHHQGLTHTVTL